MTNKRLEGIRALVTGASGGLGYAMTEALLAEGAKVAVSSRAGDKLDQAVAGFIEKGYDAHALPLDVRFEQSAEEAARWVRREWGGLDVLVNNAGIGMKTVNPRFLTEPQPFYRNARRLSEFNRYQRDGLFPRRPRFCASYDRAGQGAHYQHLNEL